MNRQLIAATLFVVLADPALAQIDPGRIGVYADETPGSCQILDAPGAVYAYIVHEGASEANASQFALDIDPAIQMSYLAGTVAPGLISIGDLLTGITITYVGCKTSFPLLLATVTFLGDGTTTTCGDLRIVADPSVASGQIEVVDCSGGVHFPKIHTAWVNETGDCPCIVTSQVCFETSPPGLSVVADSYFSATPRCFNWDSGTTHQIDVPSPQGLRDSTYYFVEWSDGKPQYHLIWVGDNDSTFTAILELAPRTTITSDPPGLLVLSDGETYTAPHDFFWALGSSHWINTVTPQVVGDTTYNFIGWSDGGGIYHQVTATSQDTTFTAFFGGTTRVTVQTVPPGLGLTIDGVPRTAPFQADWVPGSTHGIGTTTPQGAPDSAYVFASWSDGGAIVHDVVIGDNDTTFTATFLLGTRVTMETVPPGFDVIVDSVSYAAPKEVFLAPASHEIGTTSPQGPLDSMYVFASWSDGGAIVHGVDIGVDDTTFTATFELGPRVTVETVPPGFDLVIDGDSHTAPREEYWAPGTSHEIGAFVPPDSSYGFASWSDGGAQTHAVVMGTQDTTFVATFAHAVRVTLETDPAGIEVVADSVPYTAPHDLFWTPGTSHDVGVDEFIEYTPQQDSVVAFDHWSDGGAREHTFVTPDSDTTLTAFFSTFAVDGGCIRLFVDQAGTSCELVDAGPQLVDVYVVHDGPSMITQSSFRIHSGGAFACSYIGEESQLETIGDVQSGLEVFYGSCATSDLLLTRVTYQCFGNSAPTTRTVTAHPSASSGKVESVDCGGGVRFPSLSPLYVNSSGSCECSAIPVSIDGDFAVPAAVVLRQNSPNPFNPTTHIEFSVPEPQFVELLVFDVSGSLVKQLYSGEAPRGLTSVTWTGTNEDGEPVGSGVYFYQLRTAGQRYTRKMVLLK